MNSADLITSFFNNELSPQQEREFLISVASSDSMRLGLKSHVMLDRILQEENQEVMVAPSTRRSILREAAAVAALAAGGGQAAAAEDLGRSASPVTTSSGLSTWGATALALIVGVVGFFAGFQVGDDLGAASEDPVAETLPAETVVTGSLGADDPRLVAAELEGFFIEPIRLIATVVTEEVAVRAAALESNDVEANVAITADRGMDVERQESGSNSDGISTSGTSDANGEQTDVADEGDRLGGPPTVSSGSVDVKKRDGD